MILQYTTRGEVSPQGKPQVYVSCHPQDFSDFYPRLSRQLLEMADCAVYSHAPEAPMDPSLEEALSRMQLLVITVTEALLTQPCRAGEELALAQKLHIPILPIPAEPGLSSLCSRVLGNLPCLSPFDRDLEEKTFREDLQEFLDTVLISPEQAQEIHAAFQGTAFLVCPSQDRQAGLALIRRIHSLDFASDLSVVTDWEPKKDSAQAIRQADLILLAVTPGLLEKDNPIEKILYPAARAADKPILPVLLSETDMDALNARYPRLPLCVSPDQLPESLQRKLSRSKNLPHTQDPRQDYLMGLAFLSGTGLEPDRELGLQRTCRAAQADCPEALKKLGQMYALGDGVPRDPDRELQCFRRLETLTRQAAEAQTGDVNRIFPYLNALHDLGRVCFQNGKTEEASAADRQFSALTEDIIPNWDDPKYTHMLLSVCTRLAQEESTYDQKALTLGALLCRQAPGPDSDRLLARLTGKAAERQQSPELSRQALSLWEALAEAPGEPRDLSALAQVLSQRARLLMKAGDLSSPEQLLNRALDLSQDRPDNAWKYRCLLGELYSRREDPKAAEDQLAQALALCRDQAEQNKSIYFAQCQLECAQALGSFLVSLREPSRLEEAEAHLQAAASAAEDLLKRTEDPRYQASLLGIHTDLARISLARKAPEGFREHLQNALARKDVSQLTWLSDYLSDLLPAEDQVSQALSLLGGAQEPVLIRCQALLLLRQASFLENQGLAPEALAVRTQALSLQQPLLSQQEDPSLRWEAAGTQRALSRSYIESSAPEAAGQAFAAWEDLLTGLYRKKPQELLCRALSQAAAEYLGQLQKADLSHQILADGPRLLADLAGLAPKSPALSQHRAEAGYYLASAAMTTGSPQTGDYLRQAVSLARNQEALVCNSDSRFSLVRSLFLSGNFRAEKEPKKAWEFYEEALSLAEMPPEDSACRDSSLDLYGDLFRTCGQLLQRDGNRNRALALYGQAISFYEAVSHQAPEIISDTAQVYLAQGNLILRGEDPDACVPSFRRTVALRRSLLPQIPEPRKLRFSLDLGRDQNVLALQLFCLRQYEEAVEVYENTVSLLEPFISGQKLPQDLDYLAVAYCSLGWILARTDYCPQGISTRKEKRALGKQWYRKAEELYRRLLRQHPRGGYGTGLRDTCRNLTAISKLQGRTLAAAFYRKRARRYQ